MCRRDEVVLSDGKVVAIKLLRAAVAHDTVAADRLRREASALGLSWHPNVVEVYDEGHLPGRSPYRDLGDSSQIGQNQLDLDGYPRLSGAAVDLGAYEEQ